MPLVTSPSGRARYIIRCTDAQQLAGLLSTLSADSGIEIVDQIGPAGAPHTLVVAMSRDKAAAVEERIRRSDQLTIEPDRPLSLLDKEFGD